VFLHVSIDQAGLPNLALTALCSANVHLLIVSETGGRGVGGCVFKKRGINSCRDGGGTGNRNGLDRIHSL